MTFAVLKDYEDIHINDLKNRIDEVVILLQESIEDLNDITDFMKVAANVPHDVRAVRKDI